MTTLLDVQGRRTVGYLVNKAGGAVALGDVVVVDGSNDEAFTTSTAGAEVVAVGVVVETNGIANNASGRIAFQGYVALVNVNASVTRGHFGKTHTVAKQATDAGASRVLGVFCQFLTGGTTPTAMLMGQPDGVTGAGGLSGGTPALTFGTSNAAGAAASGIRTDATLAIFDATVPVTQAFSDAAAAGSAGVAARRDHKHGMMAAPSTAYPVPAPVQQVDNGFTSGTSITLTVVAPAAGNRVVCLVASSGRVCDSITQTNVVWTKRLTNNGNGKYVEVWTGVVSASAGTSVVLAFTGSNSCAATFIELPSSAPAFTTAGTPVTATSGSGSIIEVGDLATAAGDWAVWGICAGQASSYSGMSQSYHPLQSFGGYCRFGILQSNGGKISMWSINSSADSYNAVLVKLS